MAESKKFLVISCL